MAEKYVVLIQPLSEEDGGGFLATVPELPGCISDGETPTQAAENVEDAIVAWKSEAERLDRPNPLPGSTIGQWSQRVPKTMHLALKQIAEAEGVSLNQLVSNMIAESIGRRQSA